MYGALYDFAAEYDFRMTGDDYYITINTGMPVAQIRRDEGSLSESGPKSFSPSRNRKKSASDADRLENYPLRQGRTWESFGATYRVSACGE